MSFILRFGPPSMVGGVDVMNPARPDFSIICVIEFGLFDKIQKKQKSN